MTENDTSRTRLIAVPAGGQVARFFFVRLRRAKTDMHSENSGSADALQRIRVVLVEPSHPGNIGGAARALKTMGMARLLVVNPKRFPDPQAEWRAAGAQDVLQDTLICDSVEDAIADCHWVVGTSTRSRRIPWPVGSVEQIAAQVVGQAAARSDAEIAILFGRETSGLSNEELQLCHAHLQIPASAAYPSLNLAMAVQVVCYELHKHAAAVMAGEPVPSPQIGPESDYWDRPAATVEQLEAFYAHLQSVLVDSRFLDPGNPGQTLTRLRRLFTRARPDETEIQILRGVLTQLGAPFKPHAGGTKQGE
jgi:tRNA (cytidine32/uridine32-2'-O)-methyltransferase